MFPLKRLVGPFISISPALNKKRGESMRDWRAEVCYRWLSNQWSGNLLLFSNFYNSWKSRIMFYVYSRPRVSHEEQKSQYISLMCFLNFWYLIVIKVTVNIFFGLGTRANMDDFSLCTRLFFLQIIIITSMICVTETS